MDLLLFAIMFCFAFGFFYLMRVEWKPDLSNKGKLLFAVAGLVATGSFILLINYFDNLNFSADRIYLPTLDLYLKRWAVGVTCLLGVGESLFFAISAFTSGTATVKGRAATARRAAAVLKLEPRQTEALVYIFEHHSMTLDDFKRLYPEVDSPTLE